MNDTIDKAIEKLIDNKIQSLGHRIAAIEKAQWHLNQQIKSVTKSKTLEALKIQLSLKDNIVTAEWYPIQTGMPIVGRGRTILEAVGELVVYDQMVKLMPSELVNTHWSTCQIGCDRR